MRNKWLDNKTNYQYCVVKTDNMKSCGMAIAINNARWRSKSPLPQFYTKLTFDIKILINICGVVFRF